MVILERLKENSIIVLFTISIFFSHVVLYGFQIRFAYLATLVFIFINYKNYIKRNLRKIIISGIVLSSFFCYSFYHWAVFNALDVLNYRSVSLFLNNTKTVYKLLTIFLTIIIILDCYQILIKNFQKIINFFLAIFTLAMSMYVIQNYNLFYDIMTNCTTGFFSITKFIYKENSHFSIISVPLIYYFFLNINLYLNKYYYLPVWILFIIFSIFSASSTFYVGFFLTGCGVLICNRNMEKKIIAIILISLALVTSIFFLKETCISKEADLETVKAIKSDPFKGGLLSAKVKIWDEAILKKLFPMQVPKNFSYQNLASKESVNEKKNPYYNLSVAIAYNSFDIAKETISKNFLGLGMDNYKIAFAIPSNGKNFQNKDYDNSPYFLMLNAESKYNMEDGSLVLSKGVVEFGILFLAFVMFLICVSFSKIFKNPEKYFLLSLLFIQIFIRGSGYFYNGFLICSLMITLYFIKSYAKKNIQ
jgi:hypothetical protein